MADDTRIRTIDIVLNKRIDTGPIRFNNDWPGIFIRGDDAMSYLPWLEKARDQQRDDSLTRNMLDGLIVLLKSCYLKNAETLQN